MIKVEINFDQIEAELEKEIDINIFQNLALKAEKYVKQVNKSGVLSLLFTSDLEIRKLNKKWRDKDKTTDVLSFSAISSDDFPHPENEENLQLGEIIISLETAKNQAREKNHSLEKELKILFSHGLLHIFGFLHDSDENYQEMKKYEEIILSDY